MTLFALDGHMPELHPEGAWVAPSASVIGKVKTGEKRLGLVQRRFARGQ
jgi:carbonic anhydrase/acetyltransferase-like protein (isoleucine patch superfamily)